MDKKEKRLLKKIFYFEEVSVVSTDTYVESIQAAYPYIFILTYIPNNEVL